MDNVLARVGPADLRMAPWPHLVVENCLPEPLYRALAASYPDDATVLRNVDPARRRRTRPNQRNDIGAARALDAGVVAPLWREFVRQHVSAAFMTDVARVLGPAIRAVHPQLERRLGAPLDRVRTGIRRNPATDREPLSLDCQIGINTPALRTGRVRSTHVDAPVELYAMLLYFRRDDDDGDGGDFELQSWKPGRERRFDGARVAAADVQHVATVPYRANTLVAFVNSDAAVHAVSPRAPNAASRRLVNIIGEVYNAVPEGLFALPQREPAWLQRLRAVARLMPLPAPLRR